MLVIAAGCGGSSKKGTADAAADVSGGDLVSPDSVDLGAPEDTAGVLDSSDALPDLSEPSDLDDANAVEDALGDAADADSPDLVDDAGDDSEVAIDLGPPPPPALFLTINRINALMNGSKPFDDNGVPKPYHYVVPRSGFTLDILPKPETDNSLLNPSTLSVKCDAPLGPDGTTLSADAELQSYFVFDQAEGSFSWKVPAELAFPKSVGVESKPTVTCRANVEDIHGQPSGELTYVLHVDEMTPERHPFDTTDTWLVSFSRDNYTIGTPTSSDGGVTYNIPWEQKPNGVADFEEDLRAMGLHSDDAAASAFVRKWLLRTMREQINLYFKLGPSGEIGPDSVNIKIFFEGDDGAPKPGDSGVSVMGVGGWDAGSPDQPNNGRANIDWNNKVANRDDVLGLGIFTTSMFDAVLGVSYGVLFVKKFLPNVGQPVGMHPKDAIILNDAFDPSSNTDPQVTSRYNALSLLIRFGSLALSSVIAHEIGHSLGLVPYGAPPEGLFGGVGVTEFTVQAVTSAHIDTPGLNIMQQGSQLDVTELLGGELPFFNEPNLAYLRGRIIVLVP